MIELNALLETDIDVTAEQVRLAQAIRLFIRKMAVKLDSKVAIWKGWKEAENAQDMFERLIDNAKRGDFVDVANLAMFLDAQGFKPEQSTRSPE